MTNSADARHILEVERIHPAIRAQVAELHREVVGLVDQATQTHPIVVVGMGWNPFPRKARRLLDELGLAHHDLDFGHYLSQWRRRNALKMWTGWPTFPMVFVRGQLIGGYSDLRKLADTGALPSLLAAREGLTSERRS